MVELYLKAFYQNLSATSPICLSVHVNYMSNESPREQML